MIKENSKTDKVVFTEIQISPLMFDFVSTLKEVKTIETVDSVFINYSDEHKLEIYVYYEKENLEIENSITKKLVNFEESYQYFPEIFIYPLNMIDSKELTLPKTAEEI